MRNGDPGRSSSYSSSIPSSPIQKIYRYPFPPLKIPFFKGKYFFKFLSSNKRAIISSLIKVATHPMALLDFLKVRLFLLTDFHSLKATGVESTPRRRLDQVWNHPFDHLCLPFPFREGQY